MRASLAKDCLCLSVVPLLDSAIIEPAAMTIAALLRVGFADASVGAGGLLVGALFPTLVAMAALLYL